MAIWDDISQDPLKMMILMQGMQDLPRSLSKQYLPPSNMPGYAQGGGGYGGGGSDGGLDMGSILRMQQLQAAQANQQADNELQRQQFEFQRQQASGAQDAARGIEEKYGLPPGAFAYFPEQLGPGIADRLKRASINGRLVDQETGETIAAFPTYTDTPTGPMNQLDGGILRDQVRMQHDMNKARNSATRVTVGARNMNNGFDAMLGQSMEDRKAMTGKTEKLNALAAATSEMADIAAANPRVFDPTADVEALMTQGEGIFKKWVAKEPLSAEETQFLSAYNRAKQLNVTEGFGLVADLKPVSEAEVKLGLQTALGPGKPIPQVLVRAVQAEMAARRQAEMQKEFDRSQAIMLQAASEGRGVYSPAAHRLHMMEWEEANPVSTDAFQDVLATLSKKFPYGAGGRTPPPDGGSDVQIPQPPKRSDPAGIR